MTPEEFERARTALTDPRVSLPLYGTVFGQDESQPIRYDPTAITYQLQNDILNFIGNRACTSDGYVKWCVLLGYRQGGKSSTFGMAMYPGIMYSGGKKHVTSADKLDRANELHRRIQFNHKRWPDALRVPQGDKNETRKIDFVTGASITVMAGGSHAGGVGYSIDSYHNSETPLHPDASAEWSFLWPAMINRRESVAVFESTPYAMSEASAEFYKDLYTTAAEGKGRWTSIFRPWWDGKLNARSAVDFVPDLSEQRLLDRYGHLGLSLENLAFRREAMSTDGEIRRRPELFDVWYPSNDVDCWSIEGSGLIPTKAVEKQSPHIVEPLRVERGVSIFLEPKPGAQYVMGIDPGGFGVDHKSFQLFEVWDGEWEQAAVIGDNIDYYEFNEIVIDFLRRYNNARVCPERNGVGMGMIQFLHDRGYKNVHHDAAYKPGTVRHAHDKLMEILIDSLLDEITLHERKTLADCQSYKGDKLVQTSQAQAILHPGEPGRGRRGRDHWDRVTALFQMCVAARSMPRRVRPKPPVELKPTSQWSWDEWEAWRKSQQAPKSALVRMGKRR